MAKRFKLDLTVYQRELFKKAPAEICDHLGGRLELLIGMIDRLTLSQVPSTMLPKEVLQNSAMN